MNRTQRVEALKQVIAHTINGERDLAEALFKQVSTAAAREILVREANYAVDDDPEFDARREMQRELEDDLDSGRMELGADEMGDEACPECGTAPCECPAEDENGDMINDIVSKLENGDVDDEVLAAILTLVNHEDQEAAAVDDLQADVGAIADPEPGADEPAMSDDDIDLDALMKNEGVEGNEPSLLAKIKFALEYEYDQYLDNGGEPSEWPSVALGEPSPELGELMVQIPAGQEGAYNSMINKIIQHQIRDEADATPTRDMKLKDLI